MTVRAYALATSVAQGGSLEFVLSESAPVEVTDVADGRIVLTGEASPGWTLDVPAGWPSSLYRARFGPEIPWPKSLPGAAPCPDNEVYFVVRQAVPTAPILVSVPFTTWQAYNLAGEPGQGLYWTEAPDRAHRVTFDRPGGGPPPERWEEGFIRWLRPAGYEVAYCSNLDLHDGLEMLSGHRLLVVNGHDEYWSAGMRDAVEEFVRRGGNAAFLAGNTCWWQIRLEDGGRTMVCHRDPLQGDTAEWTAAGRPENTLTGTSFRAGAGTWGAYMPLMLEESYTARFADHWVFAGTGLTDGDKFGQGCLGYETDAAEFEEVGGVPRVTCRDGTPASFVVLATADLRHWGAYGQAGWATMGVFTSGLGTVFTAATVNWGDTLDDPVVDRITRNVLDRLSAEPSAEWEVIGPVADVRALAVLGRTLYAVDAAGALLTRELCGQNLSWSVAGRAGDLRGLAVPREAAGGVSQSLHGVSGDGQLLRLERDGWREVGHAPVGAVGLAVADCAFYVATGSGALWRLPFGAQDWEPYGSLSGMVALAGMNGRLYAVDAAGGLRTMIPGSTWEELPVNVPGEVFTACSGLLVAAGPGKPLRWRRVR
ncbi:MAG: hypothetical protein HOY71_48550 [Nonomuraea sp.]|nr:hypothetical protein [Nonomuraea sp.]